MEFLLSINVNTAILTGDHCVISHIDPVNELRAGIIILLAQASFELFLCIEIQAARIRATTRIGCVGSEIPSRRRRRIVGNG